MADEAAGTIATGDPHKDNYPLHCAWGHRWKPMHFTTMFNPCLGKRGRHQIREKTRNGVPFDTSVELEPGESIERQMRMQTECMHPGCVALCSRERDLIFSDRVEEYESRWEQFIICDTHTSEKLVVGELCREAIRRGILLQPLKRGDFVRDRGQIIGVAMDSARAGEILALHTAPAGSHPPTGEQAYRSYRVAFGGVYSPAQVAAKKAAAKALARGMAGTVEKIESVVAELARDVGEFIERETKALYGYPPPRHIVAASDGVLILPWGGVRRMFAGEKTELPEGEVEFREYGAPVLQLVDTMLQGGGLNESLGLYEEARRRVDNDRARACAESERQDAASRDARGEITERLRREERGRAPASATPPPSETRHWKSFDSGCNWED